MAAGGQLPTLGGNCGAGRWGGDTGTFQGQSVSGLGGNCRVGGKVEYYHKG